MPEGKILAENIKRIRKEMNESQMDFAANCGISTVIISLIENEHTDPKMSTIQKIAAYTDRTVSDLLRKEDDTPLEKIQDKDRHDT